MAEPLETQPEEPAPARYRGVAVVVSVLVIVAAWTALQLWGLGEVPFHTKGEPREALVVWEMTHGGGWILPKRNGTELPSKPPLFHWLGAVTSLAHGATDEWSVRFPSAALSLLGLLAVFATGTAVWTPRAGLLAALALMTTFEWARAATNARVDMALTFGLQMAFLSLLFFLRRRSAAWLVPLYIGISLAVLGKGPVGAVLPGLVALIMVMLTRDLAVLRELRLGYGTLTVGVLAGSWYVLAVVFGGTAFFRKQVLRENVFTFFQSAQYGGGHRHGVAYLLGTLLLGLLPWTLFLPGVVARLWRQRRAIEARDARAYLLVWVVVVFGFYAVAASKRSVYLLALYPAVALLLGWWWDEQCRAAPDEERWLTYIVRVVGWALVVALGLITVVVLLEGLGAPVVAFITHWLPARAQARAQAFVPLVSRMIREGRWSLLAFLPAALLSLYGCIRAARAARWGGVFVGLFASLAVVVLSVRLVLLPGMARFLSFRPLMREVRAVVGAGHDLFFFKAFEYGAIFYWGGHIPVYDGPWPDGAPRYVLMSRAEWERTKGEVQQQYQQVDLPDAETAIMPERFVLVRRLEAR